MYYFIELKASHYIHVGEPCEQYPHGYIEMITKFKSGVYNHSIIDNEALIKTVLAYSDKLQIEESWYLRMSKACFDQYKKKKPEILGDAIPELIEANCICGRNNLCDDCKGSCPSDCVCFECIKTVQVIG